MILGETLHGIIDQNSDEISKYRVRGQKNIIRGLFQFDGEFIDYQTSSFRRERSMLKYHNRKHEILQ